LLGFDFFLFLNEGSDQAKRCLVAELDVAVAVLLITACLANKMLASDAKRKAPTIGRIL
jgi:hypothetical protein